MRSFSKKMPTSRSEPTCQLVACFQSMHRDLESLLDDHLWALLTYCPVQARDLFSTYTVLLNTHIDLEDNLLLPVFRKEPAQKYWPASTFDREHRKIESLLEAYAKALEAPVAGTNARAWALTRLESALRLKHVCEHHHTREDKCLFPTVGGVLKDRSAAEVLARSREAWASAWEPLRPDVTAARNQIATRWQAMAPREFQATGH